MTNNRIDHTGHAHASTRAARAACRKSSAVRPEITITDILNIQAKLDAVKVVKAAKVADIAARTAEILAANKTTCRLKTVAEIAAEKAARRVIEGSHCESCGSTDLEDLETGDQGYTACCNEPVAYDCNDCNHS